MAGIRMKNIYLCPNATKEKYFPVIRSAYAALLSLGFRCSLSRSDMSRVFGAGEKPAFGPEDADLFLSVGGDGAFLRAGQTAVEYGKPLGGINTGRLGFLCALSPDTLRLLKEDGLYVREEPLLACLMNGREYYALNDVVSGKDYFGGTVELGYRTEGGREGAFIGDGLILSTPLGATGYNRSAGGPALTPGCGMFALTPICAHSGTFSAFPYPDGETVAVTQNNPAYSASVYLDGVCLGQLSEISVKKAEKTVKILTKKE